MNLSYPTEPSPPVSLQPDIAITPDRDRLSASEIASAVKSGKLSALSVTEAALARIAKHDPVLNSFTDVTADRARARANAVDAAIAAGKDAGPLAGVPFAVKNLFDVQGLPTRAGSKINRDLPPSPRDATLIERLEAAGAVMVGALNMGEYAYDFTGENIHDGPSRNPHDAARMTGGSSGGSGSAVGGGLVPLALGSDTNGSIRVPSSFCGIFGLKPTYGRLSRARSFPFVSSFDHLGPFARNVGDLALAYDAMQGPDPDDAACTTRPVEPVASMLAQGIGDLRVAIAGGYFQKNVFP
jgi:1-carboxybiuret hydrolase